MKKHAILYFFLVRDYEKEKYLFHDYDKIYAIQGLYEQLFYERLKCVSPKKVTEAFKHVIDINKENFSEMRVLDFGAGNGMMGEEIKQIGVSRLVGVDILEEAKNATECDRPGVYDDYSVKDFTRLTEMDREDINSWNLNTLTTVAALGFGDIPPIAFLETINLIHEEGWVAFNIKETFLSNTNSSGFSQLIKELIFSDYLNIITWNATGIIFPYKGSRCIIFQLYAGKAVVFQRILLKSIKTYREKLCHK